eukprot:gene28192-34903_t
MADYPALACPSADSTCVSETNRTPEEQRMQQAYITISTKHFILAGNGTIEGQGTDWWDLRRAEPSIFAPILLKLLRCRFCKVLGLTLRNSPFYHCSVVDSRHVALKALDIYAPESSRNTDGIGLFRSQ